MATYQAQWGNKGFIVDTSKIVSLTSLSTRLARKTNTASDTSGTPATNTTGMEPQKISLETFYVAGAGVDPRAQIEDWQAQFGKQYPLYLNGKRFGPKLLELDSVDFSDCLLDLQGRILSMKCAIVLVEYTPAEDKVTTTAKTSGSSSSSNSSSGYTASKQKARSSAPKPSEKNKKKPIQEGDRETETRYPSKGGKKVTDSVTDEKL